MQTYYDEGREYAVARLHPYSAGAEDQAGYVNFKEHPNQIAESLEDFKPFANLEAIQVFYSILTEINGSRSHLETCDCAFRPPAPHKDSNSNLALSAHGRLYLMYRESQINCSFEHTDWLCGRLMAVLDETDLALPPSRAVVGFTHNKVLHLALSNGEWRPDGQFECDEDDPGYGRHLMLSFWAYGDTEGEVFSTLGRVFGNIGVACQSVSNEINDSILGGQSMGSDSIDCH